jgi:general secretion pathway protein A
MYLDFYHLRAEPFQVTPDPEFLYLSPSHREALATITYAVEQGKGFMALLGEVGLGKTTLLQALLQERRGAKEKIIYLFNSRFSYSGLLRALARELDLKVTSEEPEELLNHIYQALIREYAQGNNVVLLIDEAQGLREETLEGLRLISNLETSTEKLLQIVLVGQPELAAKLNRYELRQLKQRIAVQAVLSPLTRKESREYLRFRLEKAGGRAEEIFTPRALEKIVRRARGIPRALNILADNALVTGFGYGRKPVTVKVVREVIADLEGRTRPGGLPGLPAAVAGGPGGVGLLLPPPRVRVEGLRYPAQGGSDPPAEGCPRG